MRHRIIGNFSMGLGNPDKELLGNAGEITPIIRDMLDETVELYFKPWGGCDYDVGEDKVTFGVEPAYQYERLRIITINRDKPASFIREGYAWGMYGSSIASRYKFYCDCKKRGKFKKFVDRWHGRLFK